MKKQKKVSRNAQSLTWNHVLNIIIPTESISALPNPPTTATTPQLGEAVNPLTVPKEISQSSQGWVNNTSQLRPYSYDLSGLPVPDQASTEPIHSAQSGSKGLTAELESPPFTPQAGGRGAIDSIVSSQGLNRNQNMRSSSQALDSGYYHQMYEQKTL